MKERRKNDRKPYAKVTDVTGYDGVKREWRYDEHAKRYRKYEGDVYLGSISGQYLPDPDKLEESRRYIHYDDISRIAGEAIRLNKDPVKHILTATKPMPATPATRAMWEHWQEVKDA